MGRILPYKTFISPLETNGGLLSPRSPRYSSPNGNSPLIITVTLTLTETLTYTVLVRGLHQVRLSKVFA